MQISTQQDVEAPIEVVFRQVSDFAAYERQAMRRGADVRRLDGADEVEEGSAWQIRFQFRGRERDLRADLVAWEPPESFSVTSSTGGLEGLTTVDCVALSRTRTRVTLKTELTAKSMPARLLLQSLKIARGNITRRLDTRAEAMAREIEARWSRKAAAPPPAP
ncbi:SRPBCC family protein [Wenxinia marina]|uniref:Polyketide cyclase / dehydrase and lipid transport n=1 Tax=Wenxinia marina DSM 24838 TaxID=1123501 RepID=A0A0D0PYC4_9RHOB|nr:SRPBCC family protein [Wenxinia marina]KIQ67429.1 Polyketide cyclase / dehydrase and lipid transport [Wenxinia marina DSM 24838]GGL69565.1 DNA polymerase III subunit gamma/tau [Wenxinia marina]